MTKDTIIKILTDTDFTVVDVETTGLSPSNNKIIEIALVKIQGGKIIDNFHSFINPGREIPYYITQFTGITNDDVYDAPFFEEVADDILSFIGASILTGHNLSFDKSFLRRELLSIDREDIPNKNLCTLKISRRLYPELPSKSLGAVCKYLGIRNKNSHRALSDAQATAKILFKMIDNLYKNYEITTLDKLLDFQKSPDIKKKINIKKSLAEDASALPNAPGIYYFLNSKGNIIYIGKAKSLRERLKSYFSSSTPRKSKKIVQQASHLKIQITNSELTALLLEAELIKQLNPKHNSQLKKYGNKYFLRITKNHPAPAVEISNYFDFDGNDYFGLFISREKADSIREMIDKTFALRECSDKEFSKGKKCFLADIERCIAPCIVSCKSEYLNELEKVYEFLYGKNQFALNRLLGKMKNYSESLQFEKAAEIKSVIDLILAQTHKSSLLAEPVNSAKVLFEANEKFGTDYLLLIEGKVFVKKYAIEKRDLFDQALDDFYSGSIQIDNFPTDEDLEKMKIILNWIIKNRNKVKIYYLKNYESKHSLFAALQNHFTKNIPPAESTFDIKTFITENSVAEGE